MNESLVQQHRLKDLLRHSWQPMLARFGRFTEIQTIAIEPLLAGKNCLLISSTSSGKTEAALAPLLEKHLATRKHRSKLSLLYISPTRALARDLALRLQPAMAQMAIKLQVKTGDDPTLNAKNLPELLITTPESFDSLLVNRPRIAKDLHTVILDEIHLYDNTARGDQVRILLNRLRRIKTFAKSAGDIDDISLQFCAMSATVHEPLQMAARYFSDPVVLSVPGQRRFNVELLPFNPVSSLDQLWRQLQARACRKVLCFCHKRAECEHWAQDTLAHGSPFGDKVFIHHASLDVKVRRAVEENFARSQAAVCFATATLELGIDIADLDLIVLIGAPESTSAFLQRIGRGNRRKSEIETVCFYRDEIEEALFKVFINRSREGTVDQPQYFFRFSVVVQQLCSYLKQTRYGEFNPQQAYELFVSPQGEALLERDLYDQIVVHLINKNFFTLSEKGYIKPGLVWQELYKERAIYANIAGNQLIDLIDDATGRKLGQIQKGGREGDTILFAGQSRKIVRRLPDKLFVQTETRREKAKLLNYNSSSASISCDIAQDVARELSLKELLLSEDNLPSQIFSQRLNDGETRILHCTGEAYGLILGELLESSYGLTVTSLDWLSLIVKGRVTKNYQFNLEQIKTSVLRNWRALEPFFDLGSFQPYLPLTVRQASVVAAFQVEQFQKKLQTPIL